MVQEHEEANVKKECERIAQDMMCKSARLYDSFYELEFKETLSSISRIKIAKELFRRFPAECYYGVSTGGYCEDAITEFHKVEDLQNPTAAWHYRFKIHN